jgi:sulfatase modifying factor 1
MWRRILATGILGVIMVLLSAGFGGDAPKAEKEQEEVALQEEITNSIGMEFRLIPAGSFMMGAILGDDEAGDEEKPQHRVEIIRPFYIGVCEVTQTEWQAAMGTTLRQQRDKAGPDSTILVEGPLYPVYYVSWNEAAEFCRRLSEKEGESYRLPTEAEWEYAARAGVEGKKHVWGDEKTPLVNGVKHANVADESIKNSEFYEWLKPVYDEFGYFTGYDDGYAETSPVGWYAPNNYGLYDMAGNVWEWCADWYDEEYYSKSPSKDPTGPTLGEFRVLRGGSWFNDPWFLRSSLRYRDAPDSRDGSVGFRVVREIE